MTLVEAFALALHAALPTGPLSGIPLGWLDNVGFVAGVALFAVALGRGWLYTRSQVDNQLQDVRHDRDEWRAEGRIKDQTLAELAEQNDILLREIAPSINQLFEALRKVGAEARDVDR